MHRTNRVSRTALAGLLALALGGLGLHEANAQVEKAPPPVPEKAPPPAVDKAPIPGGPAIIVPINGTQRLQMTTKKNIVRVINRTEAVARITPILNEPNQVLITGLEPGITRVTLVDVDNTEETYEVVVQMDVEYLRNLLRRGRRTANIEVIPGANNTVILEGNVAHAEDIDAILRIAQSVVLSPDRIINNMRVGGVVQVQLDVVIARVSRSEFRRMAFSFQEAGIRTFVASTVGIANTVNAAQAVSIGGSAATLSGGPGNLFLGVIGNQNSFFGFLQALREENIVKLMAEPKLVTLSGRPASFLSGGEQAVPVPAGLGQIGVQFEEFGTRLNFLPIVLGNGRIHLEVEPEVSNLDPAAGVSIQGTTVPGRTTQRVHTTVEMETGQTFVIGGLIQRNIRGSTVKVPILGDVPFFGVLFSRKNFEEIEEELVVLVTPYLVDALACNQVPKLLPGQETRSPDDFELFLEGILEAPRGQRYALQGLRYVAPHRAGPTANAFPCYGCNGGDSRCSDGACGKELHGVGHPGHPSVKMTTYSTIPNPTLPGEDIRPVGATAPAPLPEPFPPISDRPLGGDVQP